MVIGVGLPLQTPAGITISLLLFQPHQLRHIYNKKYLHADEEPYFVPGENFSTFIVNGIRIALAICYEISIPAHAETAHQSGADIYIASVAKFVNGIETAHQRLSTIARNYKMPVLLSNCVGIADGDECAGRSAVWNEKGELLADLDSEKEGLLIYDIVTKGVDCVELPGRDVSYVSS